ncbi:MAG: hypothetical protein J0H68_03755 [Sphingobacteriia bacterium]|nr:hypothetical protein [Sphingobacteriia bacterium]
MKKAQRFFKRLFTKQEPNKAIDIIESSATQNTDSDIESSELSIEGFFYHMDLDKNSDLNKKVPLKFTKWVSHEEHMEHKRRDEPIYRKVARSTSEISEGYLEARKELYKRHSSKRLKNITDENQEISGSSMRNLVTSSGTCNGKAAVKVKY